MRELTIVVNEPHSFIKGNLSNIDRVKLKELLSYKVEGAVFSTLYQKKQWDGKKYLFNVKNNSFPSGLLPKVKEYLQDSYDITIVDNRNFYEKNINYTINDLNFRDYQLEIIKTVLNHKRGLINSPTGSGKTAMAVGIIKEFGIAPVIFFVHRNNLLYQTKFFFEKHLRIPIGLISGSTIDIKDVTVASFQTVYSKLKKITSTEDPIYKILKEAKLIIVDEVQILAANTFNYVVSKCSTPYKLGLSATCFRDLNDDLLIEASIGPIIYTLPVSKLIKEGYLAEPEFFIIRFPNNMGCIKCDSYNIVYDIHIVNNKERNKKIAQIVEKEKGKNILILTSRIEHGKALQDIIPQAEFISGDLNVKTRIELIKRMSEGKLNIIIATIQTMGVGVDIPSLDVIINAGSHKSLVTTVQYIGRALRKPNIKENKIARIYDFLDEVPFLKDHSGKRIKIYQKFFETNKINYIYD